ncbi:MAG: L-seryl-tRNA(Sec) selenium transferase [candidate division NC10 bacterium]|nr:L-seryl-tRNA(Sec) selenium transferase [candidate division NC10 bacterium]
MKTAAESEGLRALPSVDEVLGWSAVKALEDRYPRWALVDCVRGVLEQKRQALLQGEKLEGLDETSLSREMLEAVGARFSSSLTRVINASGVLLHTNLGRALLAARAMEKLREVALHYCNLEYDLRQDRRGDRQMHLQASLHALTGAEAALVVNNNAAALLLILNTLAEGKEVIVSRGELVEIGGSFRLPEIMKKGGATLVEVGTTNKTYLSDYEQAIGPQTALLLKVHTSNFRISGFTASCPVGELASLGRRYRIPMVEDLGSGAMVDLSLYGLPKEPLARESLKDGADLVCFSGDKLLGGPQAGLILGRRDLTQRLAKNPLARAMRLDKLSLACLEATLSVYLEGKDVEREIPVLSALTAPAEAIQGRAKRLVELMGGAARQAFRPQIEEGEAEVGGGSLPGTSIPTRWVTLDPSSLSVQSLEEKLRSGHPAILTRIKRGRLVLDLLAVSEEELELIAARLAHLARG